MRHSELQLNAGLQNGFRRGFSMFRGFTKSERQLFYMVVITLTRLLWFKSIGSGLDSRSHALDCAVALLFTLLWQAYVAL